MSSKLRVILCPNCGIVFVGTDEIETKTCPICERRFTVHGESLIEAQLEQE